ncbi:WD40 repeat domain-containing protein [Roseinatronobacter bogoriensis]|uniref:Uncharacterized protein n=1 Tax=Roseinatronobacter bogoriensis subsp. barguzinensis TaxID=441209 RepID=A0A2K8KA93_9RHOB|nr:MULTISPECIES: WD40 repeat domain-containing protein [Rhodobaca]ATX64615.1 hypothetical protein BG454_01170 [Rhodobaca barguzinensis]MBB4209850.1 WD40 repeat protein [Rhodobaca bogoriensis DSM 18756]TDW33114.1 WD40 repeat protein [Rhodobaca barguzinensis]TDY65944.1 WD40 repeat protein [Rhodobaca bogoriensis DSM 18756]
MKTDPKLRNAIEMCLPAAARRRIEDLTAEPSDDFVAMVRAAGLDPKTSFRGKKLKVDFGASDLSGFDFSGADLSGSDLSRAKLAGATMIGARRTTGQRFLELFGHEDWVRSVTFSPDGSRIVSGSDDHTLRLWDAATGKPLGAPLRGHEGEVTSVACAPDGRRIVSGAVDGTLRLWDAATGTEKGEPLLGHQGGVNSVAFSPDGCRIVSGSYDGTLRLWDSSTGAPLGAPLRGHDGEVTNVAFSPDGGSIVSGGEDGTLRLWDAATGVALGEPLRGNPREVSSVAFSPDGSRIVNGGEYGTLRLWDAGTRAALSEPLRGHEGWVNSVAFSPDSRRIVSSGDDRTLRLWDASTGASLGEPLRGHKGKVSSVAFSPDGCRIVSSGGDGKVIVWFLDPPVHQVFVTRRPKDEPYKRKLLDKLFAHPEMIKRNVVEAVLDPMTHPRLDEAARDALENSVAALFIVGDKDLAFMQHGELELARRLQRETGRPRIIPVFTSSAIPTKPPDALRDYFFIDMPLEESGAFDALVEAISQTIDYPSVSSDAVTAAEVYRAPEEAPLTQPMTEAELEEWKRLRTQMNELDKARRTGKFSDISKWT